MKAYLITTATVFGLLVLVHLWRFIEEGAGMFKDPWFIAITAASALLCLCAVRLLRGTAR